MSQMNPKKLLHNTTFSVQLTYIAGHSLYGYKVPLLIGIVIFAGGVTWNYVYSPFKLLGFFFLNFA